MHKLSAMLNGQPIEVEYLLHKIGDQMPYFSVTANMWNSSSRKTRKPHDPDACGCLHDEILKVWPDMADLIGLHLSDINGVPMHAEANGWYWYEKRELDVLARHLRLPVGSLPDFPDRATFAAYIDAQRERWAGEAASAIKKYELSA